MMIEPPEPPKPPPPLSSSSPRSNNKEQLTMSIMTAASGTAEFLPTGFELCQHGHTCPSCNSSLILKIPTSSSSNNDTTTASSKSNANILGGMMQKMFASKALNDDELAVLLHNDLDHDDDDDDYEDAPKVQSSLQSAHTANLLLQALSFDASTRDIVNTSSNKRGLDICNVTEGVSYCYECRVHVITSGEELDRLFVDNDNDDEGDEDDEGSSMEWLRGSLLVAVDDAEDLVYQSSRSRSRQQQQHQRKKKKLQRSSIPSIKEQDTGLDSTDIMDPYNETGGKKQPLSQNVPSLPTRPSEFEYEYRHKVATKAMATRIIKGYTLVEDICNECEMPLMKKKKEEEAKEANDEEGKDGFPTMPECVVCPKLIKKIGKYHHSSNDDAQHLNHHPTEERRAEHYEVVDPISVIIENARSEAPKHPLGPRPRRYVQPEIAEAKQFVMQRQIMNPMSIRQNTANVKRICKDGIGFEFGNKEEEEYNNSSSSRRSLHDNDTASLTDSTDNNNNNEQLTVLAAGGGGYVNPGINWEELLLNGRTILSKRLNEGWVLSSTNCAGLNCKGTPLLQRATNNEELIGLDDNLDYCAVCGGSGNGEDGAYEREIEWQVKAAKAAERVAKDVMPDWEELAGNGRALLAERLKQGCWTMSSENCLGYHCKEMPLTNIEGGPNSCVVCGGSGNGVDGAYENYKPRGVVEEERALVSQELSRLVSMGWVIRESLCARCLMPLVAEEEDAEDELCILCGCISENNPHDGAAVVVANAEDEENIGDSRNNSMNGTVYDTDTLKQAVIAPVQTYGNDNANAAGRRLAMGWTLPNAGLCYHCHGIQMTPPNSFEIGCINQGCPSVLAAAYTFLPEQHESTGPVRLIGRGYSKANNEDMEQQVEEQQVEAHQQSVKQQSHKNETMRGRALRQHQRQHLQGNNAAQTIYEDDELEYEYNHPPIGQVGLQRNDMRFFDEPSVLSNVSEGVEGDSVASSTALGMILLELDEAKYELEEMQQDGGNDNAEECAQKQMEIAVLIERLSRAAGGLE